MYLNYIAHSERIVCTLVSISREECDHNVRVHDHAVCVCVCLILKVSMSSDTHRPGNIIKLDSSALDASAECRAACRAGPWLLQCGP